MAITDLITFFISLYCLIRGSLRGFMNTLINPFSIIVTTFLSIIYYQNTKDWVMASIIGILGPFLMTFLLKFLLRSWAKATNNDIKPNFLSRLGGSLLTLAWAWLIIIFILILLTVLPPWGATGKNVHNDVTGSASYRLIAQPLEKRFLDAIKINDPGLSSNVSTILSASSKPAVPGPMDPASVNEAKTLAQDPRFQKILQDPEVQKEINAHDMVKLMSNPKMMDLTKQILNDPATMKKVMQIYSSQMSSHMEDPSKPAPAQNQ
jgi:hypothetical protein